MTNEQDFRSLSYQSHQSHFCKYVRGAEREKLAKTWFEKDTVDAWRHERMYNSLDPLLKSYPNATWLIVGDGR